jgi:hypothetical protein
MTTQSLSALTMLLYRHTKRREYWKSLARSYHCVVRRTERVYVNRASGACRRDLPLQADGLVSAVAGARINAAR